MLINYALIFVVFILIPAISNAGTIKISESQLYTVTLSKTGEGTITMPAGISCDSDCSETFAKGKKVRLTAKPAQGYTFKEWGGACKGTQSTCSVIMKSDKAVTATFVLPDLSAKWSGSKARRSGSVYHVSGKLTVYAGEGNASNVKVKVYLSDDEVLDQSDVELGVADFKTIKAGRSLSKNLKFKSETKTLGKHLLAVIDPDSEVSETDRQNNTAASKQCFDRTYPSQSCGANPGCVSPPVGDYCINLGYDIGAIQDEIGEHITCIFPDKSECNAWDFWRGECGHEFSFCEIKGNTLKHLDDKMGSTQWTASYAVCIFKDGSECLEDDYFTGQCVPSECKKWRMSQDGCIK